MVERLSDTDIKTDPGRRYNYIYIRGKFNGNLKKKNQADTMGTIKRKVGERNIRENTTKNRISKKIYTKRGRQAKICRRK